MKTTRLWLVFVLVFILMGALLYIMPNDIVTAVDAEQATLYIHCIDYYGDGQVISNGSGKIVVSTMDMRFTTLRQCMSVKGVDVRYQATSADEVDKLIDRLNITVYSADYLKDLVTLYGYSPAVKGGIVVDNRLVNIQIAYNQGTVTVGSPIILGSF